MTRRALIANSFCVRPSSRFSVTFMIPNMSALPESAVVSTEKPIVMPPAMNAPTLDTPKPTRNSVNGDTLTGEPAVAKSAMSLGGAAVAWTTCTSLPSMPPAARLAIWPLLRGVAWIVNGKPRRRAVSSSLRDTVVSIVLFDAAIPRQATPSASSPSLEYAFQSAWRASISARFIASLGG